VTLPAGVGTDKSAVHSDAAGQQYVTVEDYTVPAGAKLLLAYVFWTNQSQPCYSAEFDGDPMSVVGATAIAGGSSDVAVKVFAIVAPEAKTGDVIVNWGSTPVNPCAAVYVRSYENVPENSVPSAVQFQSGTAEDVNDGETNDTTISSLGTAGNLLVFVGAGLGADMTPASNAESWSEIEDTLDTGGGQGNNQDLSVYIAEKAAASGITVTWAATDENAGMIIELIEAVVGDPVINDAPAQVVEGETILIEGANFLSTQGSGFVVLCPTDDIDDVGAETQTVVGWDDDILEVTVVRGSLDLDTTVYLFVENDSGDSNANGFALTLESNNQLNFYQPLFLSFTASLTRVVD